MVNSIDIRTDFTWWSNVWTSSWWDQRMNVSSAYLSHVDDFSNVDPNAISSKYSMYMLANKDRGKEEVTASKEKIHETTTEVKTTEKQKEKKFEEATWKVKSEERNTRLCVEEKIKRRKNVEEPKEKKDARPRVEENMDRRKITKNRRKRKSWTTCWRKDKEEEKMSKYQRKRK